MQDKKYYSDEHLNAYLDNQLDTDEKAEIMHALRHDAELSQRVCKLQKLQNLVRLSYESIDIPEKHRTDRRKNSNNKLKWYAAASVLLALGSIVGWLTHQSFKPSLTEIASIRQIDSIQTNSLENWKVLLHVSTDNPDRLNIVLNEAEALLKEYEHNPGKLELEILTNQKGMTLVTDNNRDYSNRLKSLKSKYDNLAVITCGKTLQRIRAKNKNIKLLPETGVVSSALNQVVKRQKQGWAYIRI